MSENGRHCALLRRGSLLRMQARAGSDITCVRGMLWLTQEHDPVDRIVAAGETFVFDRPGVALLNALAHDAVVEYRDPLRCEITRAPASGKKSALSLAEEIGRLRPRYDPERLAALPQSALRTTVEHEVQRMRAQAHWLLLQHIKRNLFGVLDALSVGARRALAHVQRAIVARRGRISANG
jgi:hypothetical protein